MMAGLVAQRAVVRSRERALLSLKLASKLHRRLVAQEPKHKQMSGKMKMDRFRKDAFL